MGNALARLGSAIVFSALSILTFGLRVCVKDMSSTQRSLRARSCRDARELMRAFSARSLASSSLTPPRRWRAVPNYRYLEGRRRENRVGSGPAPVTSVFDEDRFRIVHGRSDQITVRVGPLAERASMTALSPGISRR